jgi:hypothetical protein
MSNEKCNYVLRYGKNKGNRCSSKISTKCPDGTRCWTHIVKIIERAKSAAEEVSEIQSPPVVVVPPVVVPPVVVPTLAEIANEEKEKRFEERYQKERELQRIEQEYRTWRNKRMIRP